MNKKQYIAPAIHVDFIETEQFLCDSVTGTVSGNGNEILYGGIDENGELTPGARHNVWDDEGGFDDFGF